MAVGTLEVGVGSIRSIRQLGLGPLGPEPNYIMFTCQLVRHTAAAPVLPRFSSW